MRSLFDLLIILILEMSLKSKTETRNLLLLKYEVTDALAAQDKMKRGSRLTYFPPDKDYSP